MFITMCTRVSCDVEINIIHYIITPDYRVQFNLYNIPNVINEKKIRYLGTTCNIHGMSTEEIL